MEIHNSIDIIGMDSVKQEIKEVYEDKLTSMSQAIANEKKLQRQSEEASKTHLAKIKHLEEIIGGNMKECDKELDQLSAKVNAIPEMIEEAMKPVVKLAAEATEECGKEKVKRMEVEQILENVEGERDAMTKEKDELNRCAFNMECKIKELKVINAYQQDAVEELKRKVAEMDEKYIQCTQHTKSFVTMLRNKCAGITNILRSNFICKIFPRRVSKKKLKVVAAIEEVEEMLQLHAAEIQQF